MFKTCELRCHHLDRKDQYGSILEGIKYQEKKLVELQAAVEKAKKDLEVANVNIAKRKSFAKLVESTLEIHWIDNPEKLEEDWKTKQDWLEE